MPLDPDDQKKLDGLGAEIASLRVDLDKLKSIPGAPESDIKKLSDQLSALKVDFEKQAGTRSGAASPDYWVNFWKGFFGGAEPAKSDAK